MTGPSKAMKKVADVAAEWYRKKKAEHGRCERCGMVFMSESEVHHHWPECTSAIEHLCIHCFRQVASDFAYAIDRERERKGSHEVEAGD